MNDSRFCVYAIKTNPKKMRMTIITLLVAILGMSTASAQTEQIKRNVTLYMADSLKLDSMYNYWNGYVQQYPMDEVAWRNLYEVYSCYENQYLVNPRYYKTGDEFFNAQLQMRRKTGLMPSPTVTPLIIVLTTATTSGRNITIPTICLTALAITTPTAP